MQASYIQTIINRLGMTQEDLKLFTPPRALYQHYQRSLIYNLNKSQIDLFLNIVQFDKRDRTVDQRRRMLIMYLDTHPQFQDANYIFIWFKLAEEYLRQRRKIIIQHTEFINYDRTEQHVGCFMSFAQKKPIISNEEDESSETRDPTYLEYDDEEEDSDIRDLIFRVKSLKIT